MPSVSRIICHGGSAHGDDYIGACLALYGCVQGLWESSLGELEPSRPNIVRRDPTDKEINRPDVIVLDCGRVFDPEKLCFDHHQNLDIPAAFVLVADALGIRLELENACEWVEFKDHLDRFGPQDAAEHVGVEGDISSLIDPMGQFEVSRFGHSSKVGPYRGSTAEGRSSDCFWKWMVDFGEFLYEGAVRYEGELQRINREIVVTEVEAGRDIDLEESRVENESTLRVGYIDEEPNKKVMEELGKELNLDLSISQGTQGGYGLYSYKRSGLHLQEAAEEFLNGERKNIQFTHPGGFLLVCDAAPQCVDVLETILDA